MIDLCLEPVGITTNELMNQNESDQNKELIDRELTDVLEECKSKYGPYSDSEVSLILKKL